MKRITRGFVRLHPDWVFLFGDSLKKKGLGGQAKEMRGEPNAYDIPTKKAPDTDAKSFFSDKHFEKNKRYIDLAFDKVPRTGTLVIPADGIGTGLAQLKEKAPNTYLYLQRRLELLLSGELRPLPVEPKLNPVSTYDHDLVPVIRIIKRLYDEARIYGARYLGTYPADDWLLWQSSYYDDGAQYLCELLSVDDLQKLNYIELSLVTGAARDCDESVRNRIFEAGKPVGEASKNISEAQFKLDVEAFNKVYESTKA